MNEFDDKKIHDLLKKSPTLTPPESFYRGVLREIERKKEGAPSPAVWWLGWPVKSLATACVLMVLVLATREKQRTSSDLSSVVVEDRLSRGAEPRPPSGVTYPIALMEKSESRQRDQAKAAEDAVQEHLRKDVVGYVGTPSPFEEEDNKALSDLDERLKETSAGGADTSDSGMGKSGARTHSAPPAKGDAPALKSKDAEAGKKSLSYRLQARDTVNGIASQASFQNLGENIETKQQSDKMPASSAAARSMPVSATSSMEAVDSWKGFASGITMPRTVVIHSKAEWAALWQEHSRGQEFSSTPPTVNFDQFLVVGIFAGTDQGLAGLSIENITPTPTQVTVLYRKIPLGPTMGLSSPTNRPYELRMIAKTDLPVLFQERQ